MLIYHINNLLIIAWALIFCLKNPSKKKNLIFLSLSFLQLFLISTFRFDIGYDYQMYFEGFIRMGMEGFDTIKYMDWEIGFNIYTKLIAMFTTNEKVFFAITALICLVPTAWFIFKNSKNVWLSTLLYINLSFFYCSMNFLRQSIAISILLFAWHFLKKKKFIPFAIILVIASLFHVTVLIMLPMYFLVNMKPSLKTVLIYCYALLFFFISSSGFINLITDIFHAEYKESQFITQGLPFIYSIIPVLFVVAATLFAKELMKINPNNKYLINILYFAAFWMVIMSKHSLLERFSYYPYIFMIVLVPDIIEAIRDKYEKRCYKVYSNNIKVKLNSGQISERKEKFISIKAKNKGIIAYRIATIVLLAIIFAYNTYGMYVGDKGIHGVFPYQTWIK